MPDNVRRDELDSSLIHVEPCISKMDQQLVLSFLGRLGYQGTIAHNIAGNDTANQLSLQGRENSNDHKFRFSNITNGSDIILREHFDDLAAIDGISSPSHTRAFHKLVNANTHAQKPLFTYESLQGRGRYVQVREPVPFSGITLVKRVDIDVEPYDTKYKSLTAEQKILAQYGIVAMSANTALSQYRNLEINSLTRKTDRALHHIAHLLHTQLTS